MATVGIIANPISGKDIRRLVAHGSVFDNQEKVRIVRRVFMGLQAVGVERVVYMPDEYFIVPRAVRGCKASIEPVPARISIENNHTDSTRAARWMQSEGVTCIIVLGGDGTCRAVAKGAGEVPLLPISTGTNNVFPYMMEATVAGLAGGLIACGHVPKSLGTFRSCRLEILQDGELVDIALVDVAVYKDPFIAARAIWDMEKVAEIFLTRSRPDAIGLSAIGGQLESIDPEEPKGLHLVLGPGGKHVLASIAPGLLARVPVARSDIMKIDDPVAIECSGAILALDGEREMEIKRGEKAMVRLSTAGPYVVEVKKTMALAQAQKLMVIE